MEEMGLEDCFYEMPRNARAKPAIVLRGEGDLLFLGRCFVVLDGKAYPLKREEDF